jgi:hypothetical protein
MATFAPVPTTNTKHNNGGDTSDVTSDFSSDTFNSPYYQAAPELTIIHAGLSVMDASPSTDSLADTSASGVASPSTSAVSSAASDGLSSTGGSGFNIVLNYDEQNVPAAFKAGIQQAANILESVIHNNITVTLQIGYGEVGGFSGSPFYEQLTNGSAAASYVGSVGQTYSQLRADLASHENSIDDATFVNSLPNTISLNSVTNFTVPYAEARALGLVSSAANGVLDGAAGFATDIPLSSLVGVALHELTHALGRVPGATLLSLMRYTGVGQHDFIGNVTPTAASYFSIDGGYTKLADFGQQSDPSDFLNPPSSNLTTNDPFNEFYNPTTFQNLSALDTREMDVLGYNTSTPTALQHYSPNDFNGDGTSDVLLRNSNGAVVDWIMNNGLFKSGNVVTNGAAGYNVVGSGDFNDDGTSDVLLQNGGTVVDWIMSNGLYKSSNVVTNGAAGYNVVGTGDFNADGTTDVLLQNGSTVVDWTMNNGLFQSGNVVTNGAAGYNVVGCGDFNGDGTSDVLLQNGGIVVDWIMKNGLFQSGNVLTNGAAGWTVVGTGDFNGDGTSDVLLQNGGTVVDWIMGNGVYQSGNVITNGALGWKVVGTGDYNGDGTSDVLLQNGGTVVDWTMKNGSFQNGNVITNGALGYSVARS